MRLLGLLLRCQGIFFTLDNQIKDKKTDFHIYTLDKINVLVYVLLLFLLLISYPHFHLPCTSF